MSPDSATWRLLDMLTEQAAATREAYQEAMDHERAAIAQRNAAAYRTLSPTTQRTIRQGVLRAMADLREARARFHQASRAISRASIITAEAVLAAAREPTPNICRDSAPREEGPMTTPTTTDRAAEALRLAVDWLNAIERAYGPEAVQNTMPNDIGRIALLALADDLDGHPERSTEAGNEYRRLRTPRTRR